MNPGPPPTFTPRDGHDMVVAEAGGRVLRIIPTPQGLYHLAVWQPGSTGPLADAGTVRPLPADFVDDAVVAFEFDPRKVRWEESPTIGPLAVNRCFRDAAEAVAHLENSEDSLYERLRLRAMTRQFFEGLAEASGGP